MHLQVTKHPADYGDEIRAEDQKTVQWEELSKVQSHVAPACALRWRRATCSDWGGMFYRKGKPLFHSDYYYKLSFQTDRGKDSVGYNFKDTALVKCLLVISRHSHEFCWGHGQSGCCLSVKMKAFTNNRVWFRGIQGKLKRRECACMCMCVCGGRLIPVKCI